MAIRETRMERSNRGLRFKESKLAHQYCVGEGVELGAAAHNPFNLPGSRNVAPLDDFGFYMDNQVEMCGAYAEIDIVGEADSFDVPEASLDYVISSHVVEHLPDPIAAFKHWNRVLKDGGVVFMIIPKRDALPADRERPVTTVGELLEAHAKGYTVDTHPIANRRGHYYVFTLETMLELIRVCNEDHALGWELVASEETDSKVGNGFTVVCQIRKPSEILQPEPEAQPVEEAAAVEAQPVEEAPAEAESPSTVAVDPTPTPPPPTRRSKSKGG